jgi:hypothetical protein
MMRFLQSLYGQLSGPLQLRMGIVCTQLVQHARAVSLTASLAASLAVSPSLYLRISHGVSDRLPVGRRRS